LLASVVASGVAHGNTAPYPVVPCPSRTGAVGWIRGTVTSFDGATIACTPVDGVAAPEGCIVGALDPWCDEKPRNVTVSIDGAPQAVGQPANGAWQVCGLTPGRHVLTLCSSRGDFRCAADTATTVQFVDVEPRVHVAVDRVFVGKPSWTGQNLSFTLGNAHRATHLKLPPQITLAWTEAGNLPHAYLCEPPGSPAPGCSRCDATSDPGQAALWLAVVAIILARRR
jgi:MYXO-CTERM domain-containing protein